MGRTKGFQNLKEGRIINASQIGNLKWVVQKGFKTYRRVVLLMFHKMEV